MMSHGYSAGEVAGSRWWPSAALWTPKTPTLAPCMMDDEPHAAPSSHLDRASRLHCPGCAERPPALQYQGHEQERSASQQVNPMAAFRLNHSVWQCLQRWQC